MTGGKKHKKAMGYTNDMIMKKLEELEVHISEIKDDNKKSECETE